MAEQKGRTKMRHAIGLVRWMLVRPGFVCKRKDCERPNAGDHGIHGEEWIYAVSDADAGRALSLVVYTDRFPKEAGTVPRWRDEPATGAYIDLHSLEPWYENQYGPHEGCTWLSGKPCYSDGSCLYADEFFKLHGSVIGPNQSEEFWRAMEQEFRERSMNSPPLLGTTHSEASTASAPKEPPEPTPDPEAQR